MKNETKNETPTDAKRMLCLGAFGEVSKLNNERLRNLLKEVKEMGQHDAPRYFEQSEEMKQLFELEKSKYCTWADQFSTVQRAIEVEILWRIRTDVW